MAFAFVGEVRIGLEVFKCGVADDTARAESFNGFEGVILIADVAEVFAAMILVVALGDRNAPLAVDFLESAGRVEGRSGGANQVGIEAGAGADTACFFAAVAEIERDGVIGMARSYDDGSLDCCRRRR